VLFFDFKEFVHEGLKKKIDSIKLDGIIFIKLNFEILSHYNSSTVQFDSDAPAETCLVNFPGDS